jgi:hypothetical protein
MGKGYGQGMLGGTARAGRGIPGRVTVQRAPLPGGTRYPAYHRAVTEHTSPQRHSIQHTRRHSGCRLQHPALALDPGREQRSLRGMRARRTPEGNKNVEGNIKVKHPCFLSPRGHLPLERRRAALFPTEA